MEEGNIVAWRKKVGDKVSPGDILAEVETDKATMELESFNEGYLLYIGVKEGTVPVNAVLAIIGEKNEDYSSVLEQAGSDSSTNSKEAENTNQKPDRQEPNDQPTVKNNSSNDAKETVPVQQKEEPVLSGPQIKESTEGKRIKTSPLAKSLAKEAGVDLKELTGSGDGGRIVKRDVENFVNTQPAKSTQQKQTGDTYGDVPLSQMRKTIARRLVESKFSSPHFYLTIKINMDKSSEAREMINQQSGLKISFNDFIIKACAVALKQHPAINSSWMGDKIRIHKDINIGVAVAVDEGLLVPVLFAADSMGMSAINSTVSELAEKARQKKLQPQEMQGNTFTISNLGMFGIDEFTAIINPPDAAILAVGTIAEELYLLNGEVKATKMMKVTLSCDHRVIDGATGAKFLKTIKHLLENPVSMLV